MKQRDLEVAAIESNETNSGESNFTDVTPSSLSSTTCGNADDFRVDVGALTLRGPFLDASMTCVSGQPCTVTGALGMHLMDGDMLQVLDTCGTNTANLLPRFPNAGLARQASESGASVDWTSIPITSAGGVYQLCWCAVGFSCSLAEDFRVSMGSLSIVGPTPIVQDRTCVSGLPCSFDGMHGLDILSNTAPDVSAVRIAASSAAGHELALFEVAYGNAENGNWINETTCYASSSFWSECSLPVPVTAPFWKFAFVPQDGASYPIIYEVQVYSSGAWVGYAHLQVVSENATEAVDGKLVDGNLDTAWVRPSGPWEIVLSAYAPDQIMTLATCGIEQTWRNNDLN
jgi:hypothetical protein